MLLRNCYVCLKVNGYDSRMKTAKFRVEEEVSIIGIEVEPAFCTRKLLSQHWLVPA